MRRTAVCVKELSSVALSLIALLIYATPASAFEVNFRDPHLEAAIRTALDQPTGPIQDARLLELTALNASYKEIRFLDGLEFCGNIRQLQLHGNLIQDISPVASLGKLQDFYLWDNQVEDISALADLPDLRFLFMQGNQILDITALGHNAQMDPPGLAVGDVVNLSGNPINQRGLCDVVDGILRPAGVTVYTTYECGTVVVNIPDKKLETEIRRTILKLTGDIHDADLINLTSFSAPDAGIVSLTGLEYCKNLSVLNLAGNRIQDITLLGALGKLTSLYLGGNQISDLTPLVQVYGLTYLELQNQHTLEGTKVLKDLDGLEFLGGLATLYLHDNAITDISKLGWLLNLHTLSLGSNEISDVSILDGIDTLEWLDLGGNKLGDDDMASISRLTGLNHLGLWKNQIKTISRLTNLTDLVYLDLSQNQIEVIDVLVGLTKLQELYLDDNHISNTAALAGLPELAVLTLRNNGVSDISPLAANTGLGTRPSSQEAQDRLDVRGNQLSQENLCNEIPVLLKRDVQVSFDGTCCSESFELTTAVAGSGLVSPPPGVRRFCAGDRVPLTATPATGWQFDRWEGDVTGNVNPTAITMTSNFRVTAFFRDATITYTLTLTVGAEGGGHVTATGSSPYSSGALVTVTAVADDNWLFDHWEGDLEGKSNPTDLRMDSDKLVRAVFKRQPPKYTLTTVVFPEGKGSVDPPEGDHQYMDGDAVRVTATPIAGWAFDHWEEDLSGSANPNTIAMTSDKTVVAVFKRKLTLSMTVVGNGTTEPPVGNNSIVQGTEVLVRAISDLGWVFDHWEGDLTGKVNPQTIVMTSAKSIKAVFTKDAFDYTLAMTTEGLGSTLPATGFHRFLSGDKVVLRAIPADTYVFDHWSGSLSGEDNPATVTMDSDKTVQAVFLYAPVIYTLTTSAQGGGRVSPSEGQRGYAAGKKVTLVATPELGWTFDHWEGDVGGEASVALLTMTSDKTAKAVFRKTPVITAVSPDRGLIAGEESVAVFGVQLTTVTSVLFGENESKIISASDTTVSVLTPKSTSEHPNPRGAVDVVLNTAIGRTVKPAGYTFIEPPPPPELGSATPNRGSVSGGDVILIRGRNLSLAQTVTFGGAPALIAASEDTRLYVSTLPRDPGVVDIQVTTSSGTAALTNAFTYMINPQILGVFPNEGTIAGGDTVTINGVGLADPSLVLFGAVAGAVTSSSPDQITVVTPPNAEGPADVAVTTIGGTATLLQGFDYFSGAATLECTVLDQLTQHPIAGATVRLEAVARSLTTDANGFCVFNNVRPNDYLLSVSAASYALQIKSITLQRDEQEAQTILMRPSIVSEGGCAPFLKSLDSKVAEKVLPLSVEESSSETSVAPTRALAIRLTEADAVDPASVWAVLESASGAFASGGAWRPAVTGDDHDGWVVFTPAEPLPAGQIVKMTVGAVTMTGNIIGPVAQSFRVSADKEATPGEPALREEVNVTALPEVLASPKSPVYRIAPAGVFDRPLTVQIPVASGLDAASLEIYYYSEAATHAGWYRGVNVAGWMVPDSRREVAADERTYIEIQVNHSGVLQVAQPVKVKLGSAAPVDVAIGGARVMWISLGFVVAVLTALLGRLVMRGRRI